MICPTCGLKVSENMPICPNCGEPLKGQPATPLAENQTVVVPTNPAPEKATGNPLDSLTPSGESPLFSTPSESPIKPVADAIREQPAITSKEQAEAILAQHANTKKQFNPANLIPKISLKVPLIALGSLLGLFVLVVLLDLVHFLPFKLYDLFTSKPGLNQLLPKSAHSLLYLDLTKTSKLEDLWNRIPASNVLASSLNLDLKSPVSNDFAGIDLAQTVENRVYLTSFNLVQDQDITAVYKLNSAHSAASVGDTLAKSGKTTVSRYKGERIFIVEEPFKIAPIKQMPRSYHFVYGDWWFVSNNLASLYKIVDVRANQTFLSLLFGNPSSITDNPSFVQAWNSKDDEFFWLYLNSNFLASLGLGNDINNIINSTGSSVALSATAQNDGLQLASHIYLNNKLSANSFKTSESLASFLPATLRGAKLALFLESTNLKEQYGQLSLASIPSVESLWQQAQALVGLDLKAELLPNLDSRYALFSYARSPRVKPELGLVFEINNATSVQNFLNKLTSSSGTLKFTKRTIKDNDIYIGRNGSTEFGISLQGNQLLLALSWRTLYYLSLEINKTNYTAVADTPEFQAQTSKYPANVNLFFFADAPVLSDAASGLTGTNTKINFDLVKAFAQVLRYLSAGVDMSGDALQAKFFCSVEELGSAKRAQLETQINGLLSPVLTPITATPTASATTSSGTTTPTVLQTTESESPTVTPTI